MSLVPIFENPRTKTIHHFKRLPDGRTDNIGITSCGREEGAKNVAWMDLSAITCATCLRSFDPYALIGELAKALKGVLAIAEGKTGVRIYPEDDRLVAAHSALKKANEVSK